MAVFNERKKTESEKSFYVVDDLRYQQNTSRPDRRCFDIFRYDSLQEAIDKFREIPEDMTPALGMHLSEHSELDLIHRRKDDCILVTDYLNLSHWRTDPDVLLAVKELSDSLKVDWQYMSFFENNSHLFAGTFLVPLERNIERVPDKAFDNKNLASNPPTIFSDTNNPNPLSAINEAYVVGCGWIPFSEVRKDAESFGFHNPNLLKINQFNVNYIDNKGNRGQVDVSPLDLQILEERHAIRFCNEKTRDTALQRLAEDLDEFISDFDFYDYQDQVEDKAEHIQQLKTDLSNGKVNEIVSFLRNLGEDNDSFSSAALRLASRVQGSVAPGRKPTLEAQIKEAEEKTTYKKSEPEKENER